VLTVAHNLIDRSRQPLHEAPTKNRRSRSLAIGPKVLSIVDAQVEMMEHRAKQFGTVLLEDCYIFSDAPDGEQPWRPGAITLFFARIRKRAGVEHLQFKHLRRFMETYGQDLGFPFGPGGTPSWPRSGGGKQALHRPGVRH